MAVGYALDLEARRRREEAATMQVSIGSYRDRMAEGTVTGMQDQRPIPFCGLDQMLLLMEGLLDCGDADGWEYLPGRADSRLAGKPKIRDFPQTFRIRVYGREHHSLQGELRTGSRSFCFRSGMELVRLIHQELGSRPGGAGQPRQREPSTFQETKRICIYKKREESEL